MIAPAWELTLSGLLLAALLMGLVFAVSLRISNFSIVDVAWSYSFIPVGLLYIALSPGPGPRIWALWALQSLWGLRLGTHLARRIASHHPEEDRRYQTLRNRWGASLKPKFFVFFQMQAVTVAILALPLALTAGDSEQSLGATHLLSIGLWLLCWLGESIADRQLRNFKAAPSNRGKVCDQGLWRYSRHPNYFFEWLMWCAYALFATPSPGGWLAWIAPALILHLLLNVTGIPPTEAESLKSRGEAYARYQAKTSKFLLWFPRRSE